MSIHLSQAIIIAARAHATQTDKAGAPYILHPLRVMLRMNGDEARIVAVLHDVIEDSFGGVSAGYLSGAGFSDVVVCAVEALTHRNGESYAEYIARIKSGPELARRVKMADLMDNMDLSRFGEEPTPEDYERVRKYEKARDELSNLPHKSD